VDEVDEIVRSCRGGDWVGEAGLIKIQSRLITVVAHSDVVALRTNGAGFKRFLEIVGPSVREVITESTSTYLKTTLQSIPLFANVNETQIIDICREVEIKELERDILLYDTGDKIEDLFIILHGHVSCSISFVSGLDLSESPPFVDTMRENDFFGEGAVLYDEIAPSRLQYFTPKDIKVVVLSISANKLKPFLPQCPILQLRFEERLLVRKTHMDLIDTLVNAIAASLSTRYAYAPSSRRSKKSLGHIADTTAKETISMNDEVVYLRDEVKRLNGVQYPDARKERSHSKALSTFKSTLQKLKSSLPSSNALHNSAPKVPERKKKPVRRTKEAEFAAKDAHSPFFRDSQKSGTSASTHKTAYTGNSGVNQGYVILLLLLMLLLKTYYYML
jgi:CRP-like cAMP-binding protein